MIKTNKLKDVKIGEDYEGVIKAEGVTEWIVSVDKLGKLPAGLSFDSSDLNNPKIYSDCFRCTVRVYAYDDQTAQDLAGVIMQKSSGTWNSLEIVDRDCKLRDLAMRKEGSKPFLMCSDEIASLWHVPAENTMGDKLHKPLPAALIPPDELEGFSIDVGEPGDIQKLIYSIN